MTKYSDFINYIKNLLDTEKLLLKVQPGNRNWKIYHSSRTPESFRVSTLHIQLG